MNYCKPSFITGTLSIISFHSSDYTYLYGPPNYTVHHTYHTHVLFCKQTLILASTRRYQRWVVVHWLLQRSKVKMVPRFKEYDRDGNGYVSLDEAKSILQSAPFNFPASKVGHLLAKFDKDGNGKLDIDEFADFYAEAKATYVSLCSSGQPPSGCIATFGRQLCTTIEISQSDGCSLWRHGLSWLWWRTLDVRLHLDVIWSWQPSTLSVPCVKMMATYSITISRSQ